MSGKRESGDKSKASQLGLWETKPEIQWEEFKVAREYVRSLTLKSYNEWEELINTGEVQDANIPGNPDTVYKNHGWKGWNDWMGIEEPEKNENTSLDRLFDKNSKESLWSTHERSKWLNFNEAREIVREFGFEYEDEWRLFVEGKFTNRKALADNIPRDPDQIYRFVGWKDWKDWLIHPGQQVTYTKFGIARDFVRSNRISDKESWPDFLRKYTGLIEEYHMVLPVRPHIEYRDSGWLTWEDWLGSEICYQDFESTRGFVHSLNLKSKGDWFGFCSGQLIHKPKKSEKIYTYPDIAFKNHGWEGWEDWLGVSPLKPVNPSPSKTSIITIECKCKGRIKDCHDCDGKGFYDVHLT